MSKGHTMISPIDWFLKNSQRILDHYKSVKSITFICETKLVTICFDTTTHLEYFKATFGKLPSYVTLHIDN